MREAKEYSELLFNTSPGAVLLTNLANSHLVDVNDGFTLLTGFNRAEVVGKSSTEINLWKNPEDRQKLVTVLGEKGFCENMDAVFLRKDGGQLDGLLSARIIRLQGEPHVISVATDITERRQAEEYGEMRQEVLSILNEPEDSSNSIQRILAALKARTGCSAVAIRLQDGADFPYFAQDGFPADFLRTENTLISHDADGLICRDKEGNVRLECTCGLVMDGRTDPESPLFTRGGSFWTSDSFPLLDLPSAVDLRHHPRNQCMHHGYASFALIPLRNKDKIVGLIQFNDLRKGYFTLATVEHLEEIAAHIGAGLVRRQAETALKEEHRRLQKALDEVKTLRGIVPICAYCKKIRDDEGYWNQVEKYVSDHTDAKFSHGICPACLEREMKAIEASD
jgi:PAS domain S-box-containing protein